MTTENNFTATAETIKENITNGMRWMLDANGKLVETQQQQMKTATDLLNEALKTSQLDGSLNLDNSFGASSKALAELLRKNNESFTNLLSTTMKPVAEFASNSGRESFTKEIKKQIDSLNKQTSELAEVNQANFDIIIKQLEANTKSFTPLTEQFQKELQTIVSSSNETMKKIIDSYTSFVSPLIASNKDIFEKFNDQIKTNMNANIKFWSDTMNLNIPSKEKTNETKADKEKLENSESLSKRKHANMAV